MPSAFLAPFLGTLRPPEQHYKTSYRPLRCSYDIDVAVVGAGVGGIATARALGRIGREVTIFERDSQDDSSSVGFALGLWTNAWRALDELEVDTSKLRGENMRNFDFQVVSAENGALIGKTRAPNTTEFRYVERNELVAALREGVSNIRYSSPVKCVSSSKVVLENGEEIRARIVVSADGIQSVGRKSIGLSNIPRTSSYRAWRGSCSVEEIPGLEPGQVLQIWGKGERLGATFVREGLLHWFYTGIGKADEDTGESELAYVRRRLASWGCKIGANIAELPQLAFSVTKCGDRLMWNPSLNTDIGCLTLLGDAAHLSTPNLGQGAAASMEDAVELAYRISKSSRGDEAAALRAYERARWLRNLNIGVKSYLAGELIHLDSPLLVWGRDNLVAPVALSPFQLLSTTHWRPPSLHLMQK